MKALKLIILCASLGLFVACDLDDSLSQRMVGEGYTEDRDLASEEELTNDPELEENLNEDTTDNQPMLWEEKVLSNSNVPTDALRRAMNYFDANRSKFPNKRYMGIVDYTQHSGKRRFYIIDLVNGSVEQLYVAHGTGSDKNHDGYAESFSNVSGSKQSSLGFVRGAESYYGKYGYSMRLDGLESRNSRVRSRAVVIHGANYVQPNQSKMGRSWGCPAVEMSRKDSVVNRLKDGALIYLYHANQP